jgi:hypothetical protein
MGQRQPKLVTIGVDPHKHSWTAISLDQDACPLVEPIRVDATPSGFRRLRQWARRWPRRRWAIENANGLGRDLTQRLLAINEAVIDVPAKLSTRVRLLTDGNPRKTDPVDAQSVAVAALGAHQLRSPGVEDHTTVLCLLADRRDELIVSAPRPSTACTSWSLRWHPASIAARSRRPPPPACCADCGPARRQIALGCCWPMICSAKSSP